MMRRPPRATRFPCTTLFRSLLAALGGTLTATVGLRTDLAEFLPPGGRTPAADFLFRELRGGAASALLLAGIEGAAPEELARRSEEHTSELQSRQYLVCRLLL